MTDFDDAGGDERSRLVAAEAAHHVLLLAGRHAAMEELEVVATEGAVAEVLELLLGGAHVKRLGFLDERADDVGLLAGVEALAQERVGVVAFVGLVPACADGLPAGGHLVDGGDLEVTVDREGEGAGDGRGGHHQQVGVHALLAEAGTLHHAEPVLLIDDGEAEPGDGYVILKQGVGADDDVGAAMGRIAADLLLLVWRERAGEHEHAKRATEPWRGEHAVEGGELVAAEEV